MFVVPKFAMTQELERNKLEHSVQRGEQAEALAAAIDAREDLYKTVTSLTEALFDAETRYQMQGEILRQVT